MNSYGACVTDGPGGKIEVSSQQLLIGEGGGTQTHHIEVIKPIEESSSQKGELNISGELTAYSIVAILNHAYIYRH